MRSLKKQNRFNINYAKSRLIYPGVTSAYYCFDVFHHSKMAAVCITLQPQRLRTLISVP